MGLDHYAGQSMIPWKDFKKLTHVIIWQSFLNCVPRRPGASPDIKKFEIIHQNVNIIEPRAPRTLLSFTPKSLKSFVIWDTQYMQIDENVKIMNV